MKREKLILEVVLIAFAALNVYGILAGGLSGFVDLIKDANPWTILLGTDLVISLSLIGVWMWYDAKKRGVSAFPFIVLTCGLGSIGPLLYLILRKDSRTS